MSVSIKGGLWLPAPPVFSAGAPGEVTTTMNASGEKHAFVFRVPLSGTIETVEWRIGAVGNQPDNGIRTSLQDLNSAGNPDGGQDQYRDQAQPFTAQAWQAPGILSSDGTDTGTKRTVVAGQMLAVVREFAGAFVAGDSYSIPGLDLPTAPGGILGDNYNNAFEAAAWAFALNTSPVALKYVEHGYVPIADDCVPYMTLTSTAYNSGTVTFDEYALRFQLPFSAVVNGIWARADIDGDAEFPLYDASNNLLNTPPLVDASGRPQTGAHTHHAFFPGITLQANTTYRTALKPTTTTSLTLYGYTVNSNALLDAAVGGKQWYRSKRLDAGSWTDEDTNRPWMGLHIAEIVGAGAAGQSSYISF